MIKRRATTPISRPAQASVSPTPVPHSTQAAQKAAARVTHAIPTLDPGTLVNAKQTQKRANKAKEDAIAMRNHLWPTITESELWLLDEKKRKGFAQIPRTLPILMNIISDASKRVAPKSIPAGRTYLVLWCRVYGEGLVKVDNEMVAASEAGYVGERSVSTWREHMRVLKELGFVDYKPGPAGPMQYVLLLNPYRVAKALRDRSWVQELQYTALVQRGMEIGATHDLS